MESTFLFIIEVIGTFAFAISGIRLAAYRRFDWFGAYTVGLVTAIGGGTLRDLLLGIDVFWMQQWFYLGVTGVALAVVNFGRMALLNGDVSENFKMYLVVCAAMLCSVVAAKCIGCSLPMLAKLIHLDPALMAGPMITTIVDALTLIIYFTLATNFLNI